MTTQTVDVDELAFALREALLDDHQDDGPEPDSECPECGYEWCCGLIPASRSQPADARFPDCPQCG